MHLFHYHFSHNLLYFALCLFSYIVFRERRSGQSSARQQHASRPEATPLDFVVRPQSKIDPEEIRNRAKQVVQDQRRLKVNFPIFVSEDKV